MERQSLLISISITNSDIVHCYFAIVAVGDWLEDILERTFVGPSEEVIPISIDEPDQEEEQRVVGSRLAN